MLGKIVLIVVALLLVIAGCVVFYMGPRNVIGILTYGQQAREGSLRVGDVAPDVTLVGLDGTSRLPLTDLVGAKPLVLVFGSFT